MGKLPCPACRVPLGCSLPQCQVAAPSLALSPQVPGWTSRSGHLPITDSNHLSHAARSFPLGVRWIPGSCNLIIHFKVIIGHIHYLWDKA
jgi:hypothetical protein